MTLQHCLQRMHETDGLLLTQDAVYAVMHQSLYPKLTKLRSVYVLKEDAQARSVKLETDNIQMITYAEFVELSLKYDKVMSW